MQTQILLELHGNKNHRNLQEFWRRFSCFQHRLSDRVIRVQVSQFLQTAEFARGESQNRLTPLVGGALSFALDHSCESPCWWLRHCNYKCTYKKFRETKIVFWGRPHSSVVKGIFNPSILFHNAFWTHHLFVSLFFVEVPCFKCFVWTCLNALICAICFSTAKWQAQGKPAFLEKVVSHERRKRCIKRIGKTIKKIWK